MSEYRDRPPTMAEIEAHEARGGDWWLFQRRGDARPRRVLLLVRDGDVICDVDGAPSEIPTDAGTWWAWLDGPVAWPETAPVPDASK